MKTTGVITKPLHAVFTSFSRIYAGNIYKKETINHQFERTVLTVAGLSVAVLFSILLLFGIFSTI